jgi:4-amino-4-deoxy-L-arabinose transferase-like glycosyltransferase
MWDEAIVGVNAIEMAHNHNYIVTYFDGFPDMFRCKPPLSLWLIILSAKMLGFNELSLRLPSALAAATLCIYLFFTLKKITGNYLFGFFAVFVLVTCQGFIGLHLVRTGDYDALFILFSTVFGLNIFLAVEAENESEQSRHLLLFFIFLTLGLLTKGIAVMLQQLPGLIIYTVIRKKGISFLKDKAFYTGLAIFLVFGLGYYLLRESGNPGYLKAVWDNELCTRFGNFSQGQGQGYTFFIRRMFTTQFTNYIFIFPISLVAGWYFSEARIKRLVMFASVTGLTFFIFISLGPKKLAHYDGPLFPYLAIITAAFIYALYNFVGTQLRAHHVSAVKSSLGAFLIMLLLLSIPYYKIIAVVKSPGDIWDGGFNDSCRFFQEVAKGKIDLNNYKVMLDAKSGYGPAAVISCYTEELAEQGKNLWLVRPEQLVQHDKVVILDRPDKLEVARIYSIYTLQHLDYCNADVVFIRGLRPKL